MADEISKYKKEELIYKSRVLELAYYDKTDSFETDLNLMYDTAEEIKQALEHSDFEKMGDLIDAHSELIENIECGIIKESQEPRPIKEITSCYYCRGIESHGITAVKTVIDEYLRVISAYDTPYNYCPNCGRKIKED